MARMRPLAATMLGGTAWNRDDQVRQITHYVSSAKWDLAKDLLRRDPSLIHELEDNSHKLLIACYCGAYDAVRAVALTLSGVQIKVARDPRTGSTCLHFLALGTVRDLESSCSSHDITVSVEPVDLSFPTQLPFVASPEGNSHDTPNIFADVQEVDSCILPTAEHINMFDFNHAADTFRILTDIGADINAADHNGDTPLHVAIDARVAEALLNLGADVNKANNEGQTALHVAVIWNNDALVRLLISRGSDVSRATVQGHSALFEACIAGTGTAIMDILLENGADINGRDCDGYTPLMHSVSMQSISQARRLVEAGADVNCAQNDTGATALHLASSRDMLRALLDAGSDVNVQNMEGDTPLLMQAKGSGLGTGKAAVAETIKLLFEYGADPHIANRESLTAFDVAKQPVAGLIEEHMRRQPARTPILK